MLLPWFVEFGCARVLKRNIMKAQLTGSRRWDLLNTHSNIMRFQACSRHLPNMGFLLPLCYNYINKVMLFFWIGFKLWEINNHIFSTMNLFFGVKADQEMKASSCWPQPTYWVYLVKEGERREVRSREGGRRSREEKTRSSHSRASWQIGRCCCVRRCWPNSWICFLKVTMQVWQRSLLWWELEGILLRPSHPMSSF